VANRHLQCLEQSRLLAPLAAETSRVLLAARRVLPQQLRLLSLKIRTRSLLFGAPLGVRCRRALCLRCGHRRRKLRRRARRTLPRAVQLRLHAAHFAAQQCVALFGEPCRHGRTRTRQSRLARLSALRVDRTTQLVCIRGQNTQKGTHTQ